MYEKVNPSHPDKIADRIAGALVDLAYRQSENPRIAVEVLLGHGVCHIIAETSVRLPRGEVRAIVRRIAGKMKLDYREVPQDKRLSENQSGRLRCGDNGIFRGVPVTQEQRRLTEIAEEIYRTHPADGKYLLDGNRLTICQSGSAEDLREAYPTAVINPLGKWTGGTDVDSGATNRKLGSDMGDSATGGGLCLSGDTEFLSDDLRWHRIDEYKSGQRVGQYSEGRLEFVVPGKFIQNESDNFILFENETKLSMCLTPFHEVLLKTSKGNFVKHPALLVADSLLSRKGSPGSVVHTFRYNNARGKSKFESENDARLQVAFCADGTLLEGANKSWSGRIRVKRERKKERLRLLLAGKSYKETADGDYSIFWLNPPVRSKSLYECFHDEDFAVLRDEIYRWDGDEERRLFRTTSKEDADFIQFVITSGGGAAGISVDDRVGQLYGGGYTRKSVLYTVCEYASTETRLCRGKDSEIHVECIDERAPSYCFTVPSHNLIVRHNNRIFVTGNCGKDLSKADVSVNIYAWLKAQETGKPVELSCSIGDERVGGVSYAFIVAVARRFIESIGGFEKLAEWGLLKNR